MNHVEEGLVREARKALPRAYAPYSNYKVAAAIMAEDGRIFTGVNVENASYGLTICAERVALFSAAADGCRSFTHLAVVSDDNENLPLPCGACRQVLMEFSPEMKIIVAGKDDHGEMMSFTLAELLPFSFEIKNSQE